MVTAADARLPADAAAGDRRTGGKRHQSVLLVGRARIGAIDTACLVHDISRHGMMARFPQPPAVGDTLIVEVRGLAPAHAVIRWVRGHKAGMQFAEPQPVENVFQIRRDDGLIARPPRFAVEAAAVLRLDGARFRATVLDISAGGAKLMAETPALPGQTGQMTLADCDTALFGKVCWARGDQFGFRFVAPLPLLTLAQILAR
ncbi:PilZ domain-containing protein [Sphingomonas abaci]|uniref:PilZ domain-containing protein n=1 Tax=Sphingomonas abaci TaxID=237611 RepID=A0A7W7AGZ7_9SPHN|nr:PilZ domain-containing protein [Sphingomonas abaci]MBB4616852.1 hypothetical protein [Sphingomonas abaci]